MTEKSPKNTTPKNTTPIQDFYPVITPDAFIKAAGAPVISIERAAQLTGDLMKVKTIFNLISLGQAPKRIKLGRRSGFVTEEYAFWVCERLQVA